MLYDLKVKTEGTSKSTACTISRKEKEIVFDENSYSILFLLFLLKRFLMMICQKLKDLLEISNPCLLQKVGFPNLLLLIFSLKKDLFKLSFLFLLIEFMNEILMVCLNKKSSIKWVICLWLELLI